MLLLLFQNTIKGAGGTPVVLVTGSTGMLSAKHVRRSMKRGGRR